MRIYLIAKNLNRELESKIKIKEEELQSRGPGLSTRTRTMEKVEVLGQSKAFLDIINTAKKIAKEDFPVLIQGESGTGKKILAKHIHFLSDRADKECIVVHCSAMDEERMDMELFGTKERPGALQQVNGGTIVLNSVEFLSASVQKKLLRLLISGELHLVDSAMPIAANIRVISVTRTDLQEKVDAGEFNKDLMYRLNIMNMKMPELSNRKEDIKLLSEYFLNQASRGEGKMLTTKAVDKLVNYNWPGNIHELKNLMERTAILISDQFIDETHLPELEAPQVIVEEVKEEFKEMSLHELERMHICKTLDHLSGNKTRAAKSLGITVKTLYNKLHSYGLVNPKAE